jgi:phospholipid/cholesterol/gamma-HCH transport system substrate-binding protein
VRRPIALLLAVAAALLLGSCIGGRGGIRVDAIFRDIGDLPRFANVQVSDVVVGSVRGIRLDGYNARVSMRIDPKAQIPSNATALIRSTSLLGEKFVELVPPEKGTPSSTPLRDGDIIPLERTERIPGVDDAFIKLGRLLEGGSAADLAVVINSSAEILRNREGRLGEIFATLRGFSGVLAARAPDVAVAVESLDTAFASLAGGADAITRAISSSADVTTILAEQQADLDGLVGSLDRAAAVLERYVSQTRGAPDAALKDLRSILDEVMKTTGDLSKALTALARFTDLWPRAIPGDYVQLDIVMTLADAGPPGAGAAAAASGLASLQSATLADLLWRPAQ